jgi:hypothetical protein
VFDLKRPASERLSTLIEIEQGGKAKVVCSAGQPKGFHLMGWGSNAGELIAPSAYSVPIESFSRWTPESTVSLLGWPHGCDTEADLGFSTIVGALNWLNLHE